MSGQEKYEDKVDELVDELTAVIAEHTDELIVEEELLIQSIRSLAQDAIQQYLGFPEGLEGDHGVVEYYPDMDQFPKPEDI